MRSQCRQPGQKRDNQITVTGPIAEGGDDAARFVAGRRSDGGGQRSQPAERHESDEHIPAGRVLADVAFFCCGGLSRHSKALKCEHLRMRNRRRLVHATSTFVVLSAKSTVQFQINFLFLFRAEDMGDLIGPNMPVKPLATLLLRPAGLIGSSRSVQ